MRLTQLNNPLLQNINKFYNNANGGLNEEINFGFKKSNKYLYPTKQQDKSFIEYPYCVIINNFLYKEFIFEKLELFFERKKTPRKFKTIDSNDNIDIFFQQEVSHI